MTADRVDRRNRVRFTVLGVVLLALGVVGLLVRFGVIPALEPSEAYRQAIAALADYRVFALLGLLVLGLLLTYLGYRLIRSQISTPGTRVKELTLQDQARGRTTMDADVVSHAVARDLERLPQVQSASARLVGAGPEPHLVVRAAVDRGAQLAGVRQAMEPVYERAARTLGAHSLRSDLVVRPVTPDHPRVA